MKKIRSYPKKTFFRKKVSFGLPSKKFLRNFLVLFFSIGVTLTTFAEQAPGFTVDPTTRYIHITYAVPADVPETLDIYAVWSPSGKGEWHPARVMPLVSETALNLVRNEEWSQWAQGHIVERRAEGLERTVVFNPYPEAQTDGKVEIDVQIKINTPDGKNLNTQEVRIACDNSDVVYLEDWSKILQQTLLTTSTYDQKWTYRTDLDPGEGSTLNNDLYGTSPADLPLPQLTYPLDLYGFYALFVCTSPAKGGIQLRLSGDERADPLSSRLPREEVLWRWASMDRQHLVLKQPHGYKGNTAAHIDYVKLVPLPPDLAQELDTQFSTPDKLIAGYWEPYSWAFYDNVQNVLQHREQLTAFQEARIGIVDTQIGRFGMKVVYESRNTDPLYYSTIGDPVAGDNKPLTDNVGKMQQFTNTLDATIRYAKELGLRAHANFGASNCYPGSPLQGDFSKAHPDWMRGSALRFEVPEVRDYALRLYRESLDIGAPGLSIDFCRYPETVDSIETGNTFMQTMSALAKEYAQKRGEPVPVLVRFPGTVVRRAEFFDYRAWAKEGWVDYLCPSNIQGIHLNIDITPYLEAVQGTACMLLPEVDALTWGLPMPGPFLWRVKQLYDLGVPGLYIYQADGRVLGKPNDRRCMRLLASSEGVRQWWEEDARLRPQRSKGIYISFPEHPEGKYHGYERIRVWIEGIPMSEVEMYLDDKLVTQLPGPPYMLGREDYADNALIPSGEHQLRIRAKDGNAWLEQTFSIRGG